MTNEKPCTRYNPGSADRGACHNCGHGKAAHELIGANETVASAELGPWSSVVGLSVMLCNRAGAYVGQLGIMGRNDEEGQREVGELVVEALEDFLEPVEEINVPAAFHDVLVERNRQIEAEGWTPEHDDEHVDGSLAAAAACYAFPVKLGIDGVELFADPLKSSEDDLLPFQWPDTWLSGYWKPTTPRRDLVKAAALILAEIERLDRVAGQATQADGG